MPSARFQRNSGAGLAGQYKFDDVLDPFVPQADREASQAPQAGTLPTCTCPYNFPVFFTSQPSKYPTFLTYPAGS